MEHLPIYIDIVFVLTTSLTLFFFYKAGRSSKPVIIVTIWLILQAVISLTGFYTVTEAFPPRFGLLLMPPMIVILVMFFIRKGIEWIDNLDDKLLTLLHVVRIPVELTLYWLFLHNAVPQLMTFEGRNFDILCGLTAPFVYYFGYLNKVLSSKILIAWNIICLLLLANVVITAVLSAPLPFQRLSFDHPNIALFYFPFIWLPCFVVPAVLLAHLVSLRKLIKGS